MSASNDEFRSVDGGGVGMPTLSRHRPSPREVRPVSHGRPVFASMEIAQTRSGMGQGADGDLAIGSGDLYSGPRKAMA